MAFIKPSSTITLYSDINITSGENIAFTSEAKQRAYFAKHAVTTLTECSYIRRTGQIKLEYPTKTVAKCNYISFTNEAFENKIFYARIVDYEYINNITTNISYVIDYFQSFMFDVKYENCLIEREHLSEEDYQKSLTNPFDPSIYEFQTAENLPSVSTMEKLYTNDDLIVINPSENYSNKMCIMMQLAQFDTEEIGEWSTALESVDEYLLADGTAKTSLITGSVEYKIPKAYSMLIFTTYEKTVKFINFLTKQGVDDEIIGLYGIPSVSWLLYLVALNEKIPGTAVKSVSCDKKDFKNTKLYLSPFNYLRINNLEDGIKEYFYEDFYSFQKNGFSGSAEFEERAILDDVPYLYLSPMSYRYCYNSENTIAPENSNLDEKLTKKAFPQIGYSSDAYLSYLSSSYTSTLQNMTTRKYNAYNEATDAGIDYYTQGRMMTDNGLDLKDIVRGAWGVGGVPTPKIDSNYRASLSWGNDAPVPAGSTYDLQYSDMNRVATIDSVNRDVTSVKNFRQGDYIGGLFNAPKAGYVNDIYHAGNSSGLELYYSGPGSIATFIITKVQLKPEILEQYDKFFSFYGYTSNRYGVPRICNYINGTGEQPHFDDTTDKKFTYLKCGTMHVISTMQVVSDYIETLFKAGCRFLKGDDL